MRNLASIQIVKSVEPIVGADSIEKCNILGWSCVAKKGEFKKGDKVVYIEIDSILPKDTWSEFLFKGDKSSDNNIRLKTIKLRGQISQGLILPMSVLNGKKFTNDTRDNPVYEFNEGRDVTPMLGIVKYEAAIPANLNGIVKGSFPCFIPKTDETRVQAAPNVINEIVGKECYITTKMDGSSGTYYFNNGEFGVCSRNIEYKQDDVNTFWKCAIKYNLAEKMKEYGKNIAIQGEVCGPSIQKNRLNLKKHDLYCFNAYDIQNGKYFDYAEALEIFKVLGLNTVPCEYLGEFKKEWDIDTLLKMASGKYIGTDNAKEGIVIRPTKESLSMELKGRLSFKVINNEYLLKGGD